MTARNFLLTICALPVLALAQTETAVSGPIAGFVFDPAARAIRPIYGITGASYLGNAIETDVDAAAIGPDGNSALVARQGRIFRVTSLRAPQSAAPRHAAGQMPIEGSIANVDRVVWAGDHAALYSSITGQAQLLTGLSSRPAAAPPVDLSALPGAVTALAVNGDDLLAGIATSGVYRIPAGAAPQLLAPARSVAALALTGADLYFADRDGGAIWQIPSYASGSTPVRFAGDLEQPVALGWANGKLIAAGSSRLVVYDPATHTPSKAIDLAFQPSSFESTGSPTLLLMAAGQPFYVLDTSQDAAVWFVPAQGVQQ